MKVIIKNFFMDRLLYISFMFINSVLLTIYYSFTVGERVEIVYPFIISIFLMVALLIIDWSRYISFNKDIHGIKEDKNRIIRGVTREQKEIAKVIKEINLKHAVDKQEVLSDYEDKIYFLSGAIHKFKNYISVIGLIIDKNKEKSEEIEEILNDIEVENNNLYSSLEQVLNFLKLDSFSRDFEIIEINIYDEVKEIINCNRSLFINSEIFPVISCENKELRIISDKKWNKVIINQIIINAVKYSKLKKDSKNIFFNISKEGTNVVLSIKDEGIGIPAYDIRKVFEPFFTGENGRRIRNSTGIGLYIVKEVASKIGHEIDIKSEGDKGTEVNITYLSKF